MAEGSAWAVCALGFVLDRGLVGHGNRRVRAGLCLLLFALLVAIALPGSASGQAAPRGIDVSNWQGRIDWLQVGAAGYGFAFAKATEGMTFTDVTAL